MKKSTPALIATLAASSLTLAGCVANNPDAANAISVESTADACNVSKATAPSGNIQFTVKNTGDKVTEFYVLAEDGLRVLGEVENIGPGLSRDLVITAEPGNYYTVCKPGMVGSGVGNAAFTVTESGNTTQVSADEAKFIETASANYAAYVRNEVDQLVEGTDAFAAAYVAGDFELARQLYAPTRVYWERVETVAESFGDLDPKLDLREADLEEGQEWTGWHAIEKDLWPADAEAGFTAYSAEKRASLAKQLVTDTATLHTKVQDLSFDLSQLTNGAIGLLDEVATGKVTGEEEAWSHTDLWDFQANVDGAYVLYQGVRALVTERDAKLAKTLDTEFSKLQALLNQHRVGDGFKYYTALSTAEVKALSDQVNALGEPLNKLTKTALK